MLPCLSDSTGTTLKLAMCAVAGLVPCADTGIRQIWKRRRNDQSLPRIFPQLITHLSLLLINRFKVLSDGQHSCILAIGPTEYLNFGIVTEIPDAFRVPTRMFALPVRLQ